MISSFYLFNTETTTAYGVKRTSNDNTWVVDPMLGMYST